MIKRKNIFYPLVLFFLSSTMIIGSSTIANASINDGSEIVPYYTNITSCSVSLNVSGIKAECKATRVATTIVVRNVDSKGNIKATGGTPDRGADNATDSGIADITSGSGNHFEWINMYFAGMYDNNLNHTASTTYVYTF